MSTDRELLELAAKAAGIDGYGWSDEHRCLVKPSGLSGDADFSAPVFTWNPLADDGDALRLAVKLGFRIEARPDGQVCVWLGERLLWNAFAFHYTSARDLTQALRRAIVSAAAEIGRTLP